MSVSTRQYAVRLNTGDPDIERLVGERLPSSFARLRDATAAALAAVVLFGDAVRPVVVSGGGSAMRTTRRRRGRRGEG